MPLVEAQAVLAVSRTREYADGTADRVKVTGVDDMFVSVTVRGEPAVAPTSARVSDEGDTFGMYPVPLRVTGEPLTVTGDITFGVTVVSVLVRPTTVNVSLFRLASPVGVNTTLSVIVQLVVQPAVQVLVAVSPANSANAGLEKDRLVLGIGSIALAPVLVMVSVTD
jgi:hypothetical protein